MKTRNWELCILAIFLAVCFMIYAGNCYPQQIPDLPFYPGPLYPYPEPIYNPITDPFNFTWVSPVWTPPVGHTVLDLLLDSLPTLTYDRFYNMDDFPGTDNLYEDYYGFPGPVIEIWNPYERTDLYVRPKAGEHILFQFTKDFLVKPRTPDLYTSYGMSAMGMGGMGMMGGLGLGAGLGMSTGFSSPFGLGNAFSGTY